MSIAAYAGRWVLGALLAQDPAAQLDTFVARAEGNTPGPALAVAVVRGDSVVYSRAIGFANLEHGVRATVATRFDWASVAKQFTAFAIARLVTAGQLQASDPVARYVPELEPLGPALRVEHLLHHTSGLDDVDGLLAIAGWRHGDPVSYQDALGVMLAQRHLAAFPGDRMSYGNGSYILLAEIAQRISGQPFAGWMDSTVFRRFGMAGASFPGSTERLVPDRAVPYVRARDGSFRAAQWDSYPGAGGLVASVGDLASWARHLLRPRLDVAAFQLLRERGRLNSGEVIDYAWGIGARMWRGRPVLVHAGSGPATDAIILVFPDDDFAVVSAASGPVDPHPAAVAYRAAELYLAGRLAPPDTTPSRMMMISEEAMNTPPLESRGVAPDSALLREAAGVYSLGQEGLIVVRSNSERLEFARNGQAPWFPLHPLPEGRFVMVPLWEIYSFTRDERGAITGVIRERDPRSPMLRGPDRVAGRRQAPVRYTAQSAAPYAGWYVSEELGAWYQVALEGDDLVLRHARHGSLRMQPLGAETFGIASRSIAQVRFARPGGGAAVGLELQAYSWGARTSLRRADPEAGGR